ncbi:MAG: hypothetical protein KDD94_07090 [Calditrichaeota bacterium]|nr:hypothetical protein [Calditrichota bacterium]
MVGSQLLMDTYYPKFITEADAAALTKVKIPDSDAKRIFLSHGLKILKGDYVDQADLDLVFDIQYYNPFNFRKGFGGYVYYAPIKSDAFLALVPNLNSLYLDDQNFTELDFSANTNLVYLEIANCHFLTSLDISMLNLGSFGLAKQKSERARRSKSGYPIELYITNNTQLASVNIGNQPSLAAVDISGNYYLTSLDVTGLAYAYDLYLDDNSLTSISMNSNNYYYTLDLSRNKFASLSFSKLTNLYYLYIQENSQMTSVTLDSLPNLSYMYASDNTNLSTVDFSSFANTNLYYLDLNYANLTSIDLSNFPNLSYLYLDENDIQPSIDLSLLGPFYAVSLNNNPSLATVYYNSAYQNSGNISFGSSVTLIDLNVIGKQ